MWYITSLTKTDFEDFETALRVAIEMMHEKRSFHFKEQNYNQKFVDYSVIECYPESDEALMLDYERNSTMLKTYTLKSAMSKLLNSLWEKLTDIPTNDNDEIELAFLDFEIGTNRVDIHLWFESVGFDLKKEFNI